MININNLWVEKYRPKTISDMVLSKENIEIIKRFESNNEVPNLLLVGKQGIGKTTLAKIIVNDILKCQYLYINASDENGIDTIRNKVVSFAKTKSIDGKIKIIILDECDGITMEAQKALRNTMEEYSNICRFVLTANFKHKIIQPLQSRCQEITLTLPIEDILKRTLLILKNECVVLTDENKVELAKFVKKYYPDFRKIINELQKNNGNIVSSTNNLNSIIKKTLEFTLHKKSQEARKFLIEHEDKFQGDYTLLLREIFNFLNDHSDFKLDKDKKRLLVIAEHLYRSGLVVDQEINFYSCLLTLENI